MRQILKTAATLMAFAGPAIADGPVVVELYTSQGCSSCPPADALLHELAEREDVIPLALHVDYWDYIGWADSFADPAHTRRQQSYARVSGASTIYTPQMIIGGEDHVIGTKPMDVADLIQAHRSVQTGAVLTLTRSGNTLSIEGETSRSLPTGTVVQVIRFSPYETVDIRRGENAGRELSYANIVTDWQIVGEWTGRSDLSMDVRVQGTNPVVVIVQERGPGAVLASAVIR
ncbi:MAG: DUF1223 domain-containing protein [Pseudomonadota bacterium]